MMKFAQPRLVFCALFLLAAITASARGQEGAVELKKSTPASQRAYNLAAGVHNNGVYDTAAKQWAKFLEQYPDDELSPKAQQYLGVCYMQMKPAKYKEAAEAFAAVVSKYPKFENMHDTLLNLGWSQFQLAGAGDAAMYAAADKTFEKLIGTGKYVDQALYFQGESRYLQGDRAGAITAYGKLAADFPESSLRGDALYALGVAQEESGDFAAAGKTYDDYLKELGTSDKVSPEIVTEVRMRKAETILQAGFAEEKAGKADEAKALFAQAEKIFAEAAGTKDFPSADHATYRQALCASKQGKFAEAGDLYAKVADNPDSVYVKEATLDAGRSFYQAKNYEAAEARFRKVIEQGGSDVPEAAHWLARILIDSKKDYPAAAKLATETLSKADGSPYAVNLKMDAADAKFEIPESREEALALFVSVAKDHADSPLVPQALYNAAYTALQLKQYDAALAHADTFLKKHADHSLSADVKYVAAESNLLQKKYPEAEKLYGELTASSPQHADLEMWQLRLGLSQYLQQKYKEVVASLSPAVKNFKSPDNIAEAQYLIGASEFRLENFPAAATALQASYDANPKWRRADETLLDLARAQQKQDQLDAAIATTKQALAEFPQSELADRAHYYLAQYSQDKGDFKTAVAEYGEVVKSWPKSVFVPHALYGKGWSEHSLGENQAAVTTFTSLIEQFPDHRLKANAQNGRGICRQRTGDFEGGIADFDAYLKTNPAGTEKCDALYNRGLCEAGLKKFDVAVKSFESILAECQQYPSTDKVLYEIGWAKKSQQQDADAVKSFARIAADFADSPFAAEAFYHVGEDQYGAKNYAEAIKSYTTAKEKAAGSDIGEKAAYKLGWANFREENYDAALAAFKEQLAKHGSGTLANDAQFMQGECEFKLKNYSAALAAFEKTLATNPTDEKAKVLMLLHGGQSAGQLEKPAWDKAVTLLSQIPSDFPDSEFVPEALYELGWASFNLNKPDDALKFWNQAFDKGSDPLAARSRFMTGEVKFSKKDFRGALDDYRLVIYGFGGDAAPAEVKPWQAKSALQAGQVSAILAGEEKDAAKKAKLIAEAKKHFQEVIAKYPDSDVFKAAQSQLKKLGG